MIKAATAHDSVTGVCSHTDSTKSSALSTARVIGAAKCTLELSLPSARTTGRGAHGSPTAPVTRPNASAATTLLSYRDAQAPRQEHPRTHCEEAEDDHSGDVRDHLGRARPPAKVSEQEAGCGSGQGPPRDNAADAAAAPTAADPTAGQAIVPRERCRHARSPWPGQGRASPGPAGPPPRQAPVAAVGKCSSGAAAAWTGPAPSGTPRRHGHLVPSVLQCRVQRISYRKCALRGEQVGRPQLRLDDTQVEPAERVIRAGPDRLPGALPPLHRSGVRASARRPDRWPPGRHPDRCTEPRGRTAPPARPGRPGRR